MRDAAGVQPERDRTASWRVATGACLLAIALATLGLRSWNWPEVFVEGDVVLAFADGSYHARRALYSFERFPRVLLFDPYLAHPDGAAVPMPPLYDWGLGAVARSFGREQATFERVCAWASPVLAAATTVPIFLAGRMLAGAGAGLGAGALFAILPVHAGFSRLGNPDHHAAVAALCATLLALSLALVGARRPGLPIGLGLAAARAGLLLTWSGSGILLVLLDGTLAAVGILLRRDAVLRAQAWSLLGTALVVTPVVALSPTPPGGPLSGTSLSWLHVVTLLALLVLAAGSRTWERSRPAAAAGVRLARGAALGGAVLAAILVVPDARTALGEAMGFLGRQDTWNASEQRPLTSLAGVVRYYGHLPWLLPIALATLAVRLVSAAERARALVMLPWLVVLGASAAFQFRFGNEFAPVLSLASALALADPVAGAAQRAPRASYWLGAGAVALGALLIAPAFLAYHAPGLRAWNEPREGDPALHSGPGTAVRLAELVRRTTPETRGFLDPSERPEYGVLVPPSLGHVVVGVGRRATPAGNFGPYLDPEKYRAVREFFRLRSPERAVALLERLRIRYVVTDERRRIPSGTLLHHLQRRDGAGLATFRLVAEGPLGGHPLGWTPPRRADFVPYKLFEVVPGAVLEARGEPDAVAVAEIRIVTESGRSWLHRASGRADATGSIRLRVPHPTDARTPTRAEGRYRVRVAQREIEVAVPERAVREGHTIALPAPHEWRSVVTRAGDPPETSP